MPINETCEVLPYHFTESFISPITETTYYSRTNSLISRHIPPPVPPPQLRSIS
jgi:hypothetical protein